MAMRTMKKSRVAHIAQRKHGTVHALHTITVRRHKSAHTSVSHRLPAVIQAQGGELCETSEGVHLKLKGKSERRRNE